MKRVIMIVAACVLVTTTAAAQSASNRAWQQRLQVEIPLPVPIVELQSINPFSVAVDETPQVVQSTVPRKVVVRGSAIVAVFVDAKGVCLGAVPLELSVPGLTSSLVEDLTGRLATATEKENRLENAIAESWRKIDAEIAVKEQRKATIAPLIADELLEIYEEMRSSKDGAVVGRLGEDGVCGACHLKLSAAEAAQAVKQDPPRCMYCRAILVP